MRQVRTATGTHHMEGVALSIRDHPSERWSLSSPDKVGTCPTEKATECTPALGLPTPVPEMTEKLTTE